LQKLAPELAKMQSGDELNLARYPALKQIVQTGFKARPGVNLFKDLAVYATPQYASKQIPVNQPDDVAMISIAAGTSRVFESKELVNLASSIWSAGLSASVEDKDPLILVTDLESPLGFATFLGCSTNFKKVFIPGTSNLSTMLKQFPI